MEFNGEWLKAQGSWIKKDDGGLRFSLVPFALRPVPDSYASFLGISEALHMDIFHQPLRSRFSLSFLSHMNKGARPGPLF
jgi:hypothetical protein